MSAVRQLSEALIEELCGELRTGKTVRDAANACGITHATLMAWMAGATDDPSSIFSLLVRKMIEVTGALPLKQGEIAPELHEYFSAKVITVHVLDPVSGETLDGAAFTDERDVCAWCGEEFASHSNEAIETHRLRSLTDPDHAAGEDPANYGRVM